MSDVFTQNSFGLKWVKGATKVHQQFSGLSVELEGLVLVWV
jgi:hypothetical protein